MLNHPVDELDKLDCKNRKQFSTIEQECMKKINDVNDHLGGQIKENFTKDAQQTVDFEKRIKDLEQQLLMEIAKSKAAAKKSPVVAIQKLPEIDPNTATLSDVMDKCNILED